MAKPLPDKSNKMLVNIVDGGDSTLREVSEWLAKRWEVLWVEGKPRSVPMVRDVIKLLAHETRTKTDAEAAVRASVLLSQDEVRAALLGVLVLDTHQCLIHGRLLHTCARQLFK